MQLAVVNWTPRTLILEKRGEVVYLQRVDVVWPTHTHRPPIWWTFQNSMDSVVSRRDGRYADYTLTKKNSNFILFQLTESDGYGNRNKDGVKTDVHIQMERL